MKKDTNDPILQNILKNSRSYEDDLLEHLKDPEFAQYYLEAALDDYEKDGDSESLLVAMRDVAQARGRAGNLTIQLDNVLGTLSGLGFRVRLERHDIPAQVQAVSAEHQKAHV